jgi:peroxiredoxin
MAATLFLFTCAFLPAQPADSSPWLFTPRLSQGQELVYNGTFTEEVIGQGVQFNRSYRLETSVFILDTPPRGVSTALLTVLQLRALRQGRDEGIAPPASSVRLELARIDLQGHAEGADGTSLLVPLEGPPTVECGQFVESPPSHLGRDKAWDVTEPGRPPRTWHVAGSEYVQNTSCLKLVGLQQSVDWEEGRADRAAWRRRDTVWVAPSVGVALRVERVIERREPARKEPTQRSVVRYELFSRLTYRGQLFEDRKREVLQARRFAEEAAPYLHRPTQYQPQLNAILKKIGYHLDNELPVQPYRLAVLQVKRRVEAALRGEVAPEPDPETGPAAPAAAILGKRAPDFVATDLIQGGSVRLHRLLGRPVLLVFFNPASATARPVLRFAADKQQRGVTVVGMAVTDDVAAVKKLHADLRLAFPVLAGKGFHVSYGVDATPRMVLLDAEGIVRGAYTGWGSETPREVTEELRNWLRR